MRALDLPWGLDFDAACDTPGVSVSVSFERAGGTLRATVTNDSDAEARPRTVRLAASLELAAAGGWAWVQGRFMQRDAFVRTFATAPIEDYEGDGISESPSERTYRSSEQLALVLPVLSSPTLVIGSLRMDRYFLDIELTLDAEESEVTGLALVYDVDGLVLAPGESAELQPVVLAEGRDPVVLMEAYASRVAEAMGARVPERPLTGWCSWYQYYGNVTEADVLENLEAIGEARLELDYIQIDDGYQAATGDWLKPGPGFPSGMAALASRIRDRGYRPGLWLAPFLLHEGSDALREHPEIALRSAAGEPLFVDTWLGRCAVLDCTAPAAAPWLHNVVSTVTGAWGFDVLKLDALAFAAQPAHAVAYHEPGTTAAGNLRRGLEIIREAAGDACYLLGCTCHFGPAIGLVDAMRVGPDVAAKWSDGTRPSVRHAMRMTLQRNWMHGRWWANDPDCLLVRESETELSAAERRFLATGIALSGGMTVVSDNLAALGPVERAVAASLLPPTGVAARPMDAGDGPVPSVWRARLNEERTLLGVLNWSDEPMWAVRDELLAPGETAFDFWNRRMAGMGDVLLGPHEGLLLQVSAPGAGPRLVGDSGSLTFSGLATRAVSGQLHVTNMLDRPRTIAVESRGHVHEVSLEPGERRTFQ